MEFLGIKETCLYFEDLEQAKEFYHVKLALPLISYEPGRHIFFRAGRCVLLCFNPNDSRHKKSPPGHYGSGKYHFALEVETSEYEKVKHTLVSRGISITDEVTWKPGVQSFYFEDPIGNVVEVVPEDGMWD